MRSALRFEIIDVPTLEDRRFVVMSEKGNFDSADVRIAQKNSKPDADTESRLASLEAAIQELLKRVEAAARAAESLEPGRKKMEKHMSTLTRTEKEVYPLL